MTRFIHLFICSAFFMSLSVFSYGQKAEITFKSEILDFGTIKEVAGPTSRTFTFTNTGNAPLVINDVQASCGCTTPEWTKSPVLPGKTGTIKTTYDPAGRPYPFDKTITVTSNATTNPTVVLHIKGNVDAKVLTIEEQYPFVVGDLRVKAGSIEMSRVAANSVRTENVEVYNASSSPIIVSFEKLPAHVQLTAEPISVPAKQKGTIKCVYNTGKKNDFGPVTDVVVLKAGTAKGELKINATIDEDFSKLTPAELEKAPILGASSYSFDFKSQTRGAKVTGTFEVRNDGKSDLIIRKITSDCPCIKSITSTLTIKPGQIGKLELQLDTANETPGTKYYTILLTTNAPNQKQVSLFLTGSIK